MSGDHGCGEHGRGRNAQPRLQHLNASIAIEGIAGRPRRRCKISPPMVYGTIQSLAVAGA